MRKILLLLLLPVFTQAQTASNDMFRVNVEGTLVTITPLLCPTMQIQGSVGSKLYDTLFTINGSVSFSISPALIGKELRFRTQTKCGGKSNSSWVGFIITPLQSLPVTVKHFSAHPNKSAVQVFYHVEISDGDGFSIERSSDGHKWQTLFTSVATTRNPYTEKRSIIDFATTEKNYYRLKLWNGLKYSYSNILYVPMQKDSVSLFNLQGVHLKTVKADRVLEELRTLPRGVYVTSDGIKLFN